MDAYQRAKEAKKRREAAAKGADPHAAVDDTSAESELHKTDAALRVTDKDIANAALDRLGHKAGYQAGYMAGRRRDASEPTAAP